MALGKLAFHFLFSGVCDFVEFDAFETIFVAHNLFLFVNALLLFFSLTLIEDW